MVTFNVMAFDKMKAALGYTKDKDFLARLSTLGFRVTRQTYYSWKNTGSISGYTLHLLCNAVHFPIAYFFCSDLHGPDAWSYEIPAQWKDITFTPEAIVFIVHRRDGYKENVKNIAKHMGMNKRFKAFLIDDRAALNRLSLSSLIRRTQEAKVYLGDVFHDENATIPIEEGVIPESAEATNQLLQEELSQHKNLDDELARKERCNDALYKGNLALETKLKEKNDEISKYREIIKDNENSINAQVVAILKQNETIKNLEEENQKLKQQQKDHMKYEHRKLSHAATPVEPEEE